MKRRDVYLKLTRHNGRAGAHGTYNPKHNDRSFNLANSEHIDPERAKGNIYWDCFHGFRSALDPQDPDDLATTFSDVERQFYETHYTAFVESQNERNAKIRHTERNRSIPDLLSSRKTCPEETIYQLGTLDEHASTEDLLNIVTEFIEEFKAKFGEHVHVLDWALHLDESTPHIHERHVFDCENRYGEIAPQQEKALEALGFDLPDPGKPLSRRNNRKITFDAACRKMLFEIAKRHGLELEEEAEYGNRKYLEKQDFILAKQKEQLAIRQSKLDELTLKVSEMETLLEDVSAAAYDKAVEVVTDVVRTETRKEDMRMIEDTKKWVLSPERKAPQATREYAAKHLDTVLDKFLKTMQTTAARLQEKLLKPEVRQKGKEQVKKKARDSVLQLLSRLQSAAESAVRCAAHGRVPVGPAGCFLQTLLPPSRSGSASGAHSAQCYGVFHPADYGSCNCLCSVCCRSTDNRYTAFPYSWPTCAPAGCHSPHSRESLQTEPPFRHRSAYVFRFPESAAPVQTALPELLLHGCCHFLYIIKTSENERYLNEKCFFLKKSFFR